MADSPPPADPPPNGDAAPADGAAAGPAPSGKPGARRRAAARPWQGGRFRSSAGRGGPPAARRRAIFILSGLALLLLGATAAWVLYPSPIPSPHIVPIVINQYGRDFPEVPWADQDREALRARAPQSPNTHDDQELRQMREELNRLGHGLPADQPVLLYLRAHAAATADDDLAVLPGDARLDDESPGMSLREVLRLVKACPAEKRLVLLDVMQPLADVRTGVLLDEAAGRAAAVLRDGLKDDPKLFVLCACSPGQTSLASEEMGHTVFVHYVIEGLSGKADGWGGAPDNRVSVRELADFVRDNVDYWAWHNRRVHQTPVLLGPDGPGFAILPAGGPPPDKETPLDRDYPAALKAAWDLRDGWLADGAVWTPPDLYRRLEDAALRAEQRWRAGVPLAEVEKGLAAETDAVKKERVRRGATAGPGEPDSLALAVAEGKQPPAQAAAALRQLASMAAEHAKARPPKDPAKPAGDAGAGAAGQPPADAKAFQQAYADKPFELAWLIFRAAKENPSTRPEELAFWLSLLHGEGRPAPDYAEVRVLAQLAKLQVPDGDDAATDWGNAVASLLASADTAAQANAALDLMPQLPKDLSAYLRTWRKDAADQYQGARDAFLQAKAADRRAALATLSAAAAGPRGYDELRAALGRLRGAMRRRDDALRLIPGFAENGAPSPRGTAAWADQVGQAEKAADLAQALTDRLANPRGLSPKWFADTETLAGTLGDALDALAGPASPQRLRSLKSQSPRANGADAEDIRLTLRLPALSSPDRVDLWKAWRELAGRLHEESAAAQAGPAEPAASGPEAEPADNGLLRARAALALLRLDGLDTAELARDLKQAPKEKDERAALRDLGRKLRKRLKEAPPAPDAR